MAITVIEPNGITVEFPDGTSADVIRKVMQQRGGAPDQQPPAQQPEARTDGLPWYADIPVQAVRGFNQGVNSMINLPRDIAAAGAGALGFDYPERFQPLEDFMNQGPAPSTTPGRYAEQAGKAVGASAIPTAGIVSQAPRVAAMAAKTMPATSTAGQIANQTAQQIKAAPGAAVGLDVASATSGGIAQQGAQESGMSPLMQTIVGMAGGMAPAIGMTYAIPSNTQIGTNTGRNLSQARASRATEDAAAFERQDVRSFGPAFNEGPIASVGKQLTETPLVGAPLRNNLDETYFDAAAAASRIADDIAPNATFENAGLNVQRGLDRFRDIPFEQLDPATVRATGIDPNSPVQQQQGGGQRQMQRIQQTQPLVQQITGGSVQNSRGNPVPLPRTRLQMLTARTRLEDVSDAELSSVIRTPADQTSFSTRLEALYEKAFRAIPPLMRSNNSRDPLMLPTANASRVVREIVGDEARTGITAGLQGRYGNMFQKLSNPRANVTLPDLRSMRTAIGRELSNFGMYEASLDRSQLRRLYASLSDDIAVGMQDIAARAAQATQLPGNRQLSQSDARRAAQALRDMQVADRYARQGFERMDRFLQVVKQPNPQRAAAALVRSATEGGAGNMRMFRSAMAVLRPEERAEFAALIVREMGNPTDGARGLIQESGWSFDRFMTAYNKQSPQARNMLFSPEHQRDLQDLARISRRMADLEALANTSRSATNAINLTGATGAMGSAAMGDLVTPAVIGGAGLGTSVMMSRPAYTRWMLQYMRLRASVRAGTNRTVAPLLKHVSGLERMAQENPALWPVYALISEEVGAGENDGQ